MRTKKGQVMVEYAVMFTAIIAAVIIAAAIWIRPALDRFFGSTAGVIDSASTRAQSNF